MKDHNYHGYRRNHRDSVNIIEAVLGGLAFAGLVGLALFLALLLGA